MKAAHFRHGNAVFKRRVGVNHRRFRDALFDGFIDFSEIYVTLISFVAALVVEMQLHLCHVAVDDFAVFFRHAHKSQIRRRHGNAVALAEGPQFLEFIRRQQTIGHVSVVPFLRGARKGLRGSTGGAGGAASGVVKATLAALTTFEGVLYCVPR